MPESLQLIRRDCAQSQVRSYARRYEEQPGLGWSVGTFLLMVLGGLACWGIIIGAILTAV